MLTVGLCANFPITLDWLWHQCPRGPVPGAWGNVRTIGNTGAVSLDSCDALLILNSPHRLERPGFMEKLTRRVADPSLTPLPLPRERIVMTTREPPGLARDWWFTHARQQAALSIGHDPRCTQQCLMPARWTTWGDWDFWMGLAPEEKPIRCACVTTGTSALPGHRHRLEFLRRVLDAGIDVSVVGRNLPEWVHRRPGQSAASGALLPAGPLADKAQALRAARYTLALENDAETPLYATEKIWEPLLAWSLPIYHGSTAVDSILPAGSFVRLPDLGERGLSLLRETISDASAWHAALPALKEARRILLTELNMAKWVTDVFTRLNI